ncbi:MAG: MBL fold metallo-hydrolase, partial [Desulfomonile sp.]|nr:MBL fold metallo-hydrolase [Desulfomonile sp.]
SPADIDVLVISHGHLDHFMLAPAILARSKARVAAHVIDTPGLCNPWGLLHMFVSRQNQMRATGMPPAYKSRERIKEAVEGGFGWDPGAFAVKVDTPLLEDGPLKLNGSAIPGIEVLHIPGHTPGSVGLLVGSDSGKVLMCGDVLLFPITPHPDELFAYLQTLARLKGLEGVELVLPAHGKAIHDLGARVEFLQLHHKKRLKATYDACREPRCVWDIAAMPKYFDTYVDPGKFNYLAGSEALVHMEMLAMVNGLSRSHIRDSVHYFRNSGEPFEQVYSRIVERMESGSVAPLMRY